jgi:hypothetical protein
MALVAYGDLPHPLELSGTENRRALFLELL